MQEIIYHKEGKPSNNHKSKQRKIELAAKRYVLINGELYRRSFKDQPLLKCVDDVEGNYILTGLKKGLDDKKGTWLQVLHSTLWSLRTTVKEVTGKSPYTLVIGSECLMPVKVGSPSLRVQLFEPKANEHSRRDNLNLVETGSIRTITRRSNKGSPQWGDLVQRKAAVVPKGNIHGKPSATWEGLYQVYEEQQPGTYRLMELDGTVLLNIWKTDQLKKYFA
ncbi:Midasin [Bienertia sinuspersici]